MLRACGPPCPEGEFDAITADTAYAALTAGYSEVRLIADLAGPEFLDCSEVPRGCSRRAAIRPLSSRAAPGPAPGQSDVATGGPSTYGFNDHSVEPADVTASSIEQAQPAESVTAECDFLADAVRGFGVAEDLAHLACLRLVV
jgi:hypothetical protein